MTQREHAAIMTGLRILQNEIEKHGNDMEDDPVWDIMTCGGELTPLTIEEINALCERINTSNEYEVTD
jgi:hypothetical protein